MNEYQMHQSIIVSNIRKSKLHEDINFERDYMKCFICPYVTTDRALFEKHMFNHYEKNNMTVFLTPEQVRTLESHQDTGNCSSSTSSEHAELETNEISKPDSGVLQVNSPDSAKKLSKTIGGREGVKSCKLCKNFVYRTKDEYWEHMRHHITGFTCTECQFVTKYKHHMTHHWRSVHEGTKPFQCNKCKYSCVSKSMLTSHMKKHSDVYPYNCADCTYKTKFCNALKKHLRKKGHQPAIVLNADGSPNPSQIIDVYGTKRGPKQKPSVEKQDELNQNLNVTINNNQLSPAITQPVLPFQSSTAHYTAVTTTNVMNDAISQSDMNQNERISSFIKGSPHYRDMVEAFNLPMPAIHDPYAPLTENMLKIVELNALMELDKFNRNKINTLIQLKNQAKYLAEDLAATCSDATDINQPQIADDANATDEPLALAAQEPQEPLEPQEADIKIAPLDLRITKNQKSESQLLVKVIGTSKRKGRAMKLERRVMEEDADEDTDEQPGRNEVEPREFSANPQVIQERIEKLNRATQGHSVDSKFICHYCEIIFSMMMMYQEHMRYHGFDDPYMCNICGLQFNDKLSFFLHIGRSSHNY